MKNSVQGKRCRHILDYSKKEIRACWYTDLEKKMLQSDMKYTIKMMESSKTVDRLRHSIDEINYTSVGLQCYTASDAKTRDERRKQEYGLVLGFFFNIENCSIRDELIASSYSQLSQSCKDLARERALQLQKSQTYSSKTVSGDESRNTSRAVDPMLEKRTTFSGKRRLSKESQQEGQRLAKTLSPTPQRKSSVSAAA